MGTGTEGVRRWTETPRDDDPHPTQSRPPLLTRVTGGSGHTRVPGLPPHPPSPPFPDPIREALFDRTALSSFPRGSGRGRRARVVLVRVVRTQTFPVPVVCRHSWSLDRPRSLMSRHTPTHPSYVYTRVTVIVHYPQPPTGQSHAPSTVMTTPPTYVLHRRTTTHSVDRCTLVHSSVKYSPHTHRHPHPQSSITIHGDESTRVHGGYVSNPDQTETRRRTSMKSVDSDSRQTVWTQPTRDWFLIRVTPAGSTEVHLQTQINKK